MQLNFSNRVFGIAAACLLVASSALAQDPVQVGVPALQQTDPAISLDQPSAAAAEANNPANGAAPAREGLPDIVFGEGGALPVSDKAAKKGPPEVKSLFFTAQEMASIRKAVGVYTRIISGEGSGALDFLKRLQGNDKPKETMRYFIYPQFFLASLVYHSQDDWSVYINNQKLTNREPEGSQGISVKSIDKDKVTLQWIPADLQKVEDVWTITPNKEVRVDLRRGKVTFTLRPNQTFSSYVMRVLEGKVMPMVLDTSPKDKAGEDGKPSVSGKKSHPGTERDFLDRLTGAR